MVNTFGRLVRQARLSLKMTMRELAEKMEWSLSYINEIEHGRTKPPRDQKTLKKMARVLKTDINELLETALHQRLNFKDDPKISKFFKKRGPRAMAMLRDVGELDDDDFDKLLNHVDELKNRRN